MAKQNYMEPGHIFGRSKLVKAFDAKRIDDILGKAATHAAEPPIVEPEAPKSDIMETKALPDIAEPPIAEPEAPKADIMETKALPDIAEPPIAEPEAPKAEPKKRGRKAGPKQVDTIETPPADDGGINNEDGTDENGADE